jgi:hypothetical protein
MKKILAAVLVVMCATNAYAISLANGYRSSGVLGPNAHTHVTTRTSKIYAVTITPYAADGYAQIIETKGATTNDNYTFNNHVLVYAKGHTANDSIHLEYSDGLNCGGNMFVNCMNAEVSVAYKDD